MPLHLWTKKFEILDLDPPINATSHYGACHFRYNLALICVNYCSRFLNYTLYFIINDKFSDSKLYYNIIILRKERFRDDLPQNTVCNYKYRIIPYTNLDTV